MRTQCRNRLNPTKSGMKREKFRDAAKGGRAKGRIDFNRTMFYAVRHDIQLNYKHHWRLHCMRLCGQCPCVRVLCEHSDVSLILYNILFRLCKSDTDCLGNYHHRLATAIANCRLTLPITNVHSMRYFGTVYLYVCVRAQHKDHIITIKSLHFICVEMFSDRAHTTVGVPCEYRIRVLPRPFRPFTGIFR